MRYRIDLAYEGTAFHGWARQPGLDTVQGELESWIKAVLRLQTEPQLVVAGRTDAGVHARGQVCHLDLPDEIPAQPDDLTRRLRRVLPASIAIKDVTAAPADFDARFSAVWRRYCYRLAEADLPPDPLLRGHVAEVREELHLDVLKLAAAELIGLRDFAAFCKPREGATTIRDLKELTCARRADGVVEVWLLADAFCHSMVRSLVGALTAVAGGRRDLEWLKRVRDHGSRHNEVHVMPAHGLTLEEVGYPPPDQLAHRAEQARAMRSLES